MFARIKKAGRYEYLQIVENHREDKKSVQRVIATVGRIDELKGKGDIEGLIRSLSRFSERALMVLSGQSNGIHGVDGLSSHHLYRAMAYLWEEMEDQSDRTHFSPRVTKDVVEEELFHLRRDLFSGHDMVFFDTTSLYFEGAGRKTIGHSKDHRHDLHQMIVGVILDNEGNPLCSKMWPGNAADIKSLIPVMDRLGRRFANRKFCIVSDRGMISKETMAYVEQEHIPYILGTRMRMVKQIKEEVPSRAGRYWEVRP